MTQQFENFVNAALDKSLASDVTLPTANKIPVFTGIGRQVTGKTTTELGLATSSQLTDKADLVNGLVPSNQLPGYVDDVLEYADLASFPLLGEASKLYIAIDTNLVYRWSGSTYAVTSSSLALGDTSTTAYRGDKGKTAYDHSQATGNPHNLPASSTNTDGYLTSTDWNTFNGKQAALGDVITANTYGSSTQYPIVTVNAKGIVTGITLQTVSAPATFSDSAFRIQDNGDATKQLAFEVSGIATGQTKTITMPNANVNLGEIPSSMSYSAGSISLTTVDGVSLSALIGDLPAYSTTNSNSITGSLSQILGGTGNNAVGTNTIMIGGKYNYNVVGANFQTYINAQNIKSTLIKTINARISSSATFSGSSTSDIKCVSVEYNLMNNHKSNTYATADTVQTLDEFHLPKGVIGVRGHGIHELSFIAVQNNSGSKDSTFQDQRISGKRLFHVNSDYSGTVTISSIQTIGTDYSTSAATLSITIDESGLILIAVTGGSTNISLMCNLRSTYTFTDWM